MAGGSPGLAGDQASRGFLVASRGRRAVNAIAARCSGVLFDFREQCDDAVALAATEWRAAVQRQREQSEFHDVMKQTHPGFL